VALTTKFASALSNLFFNHPLTAANATLNFNSATADLAVSRNAHFYINFKVNKIGVIFILIFVVKTKLNFDVEERRNTFKMHTLVRESIPKSVCIPNLIMVMPTG